MHFRGLTLFIAFGALLVQSAPIADKRQIGDLQCNVARLQILNDVAQMKQTVKKLSNQVTDDPAAAAAISTAQDGIAQAQDAIGRIAKAILTAQTANPADRDDVQAGLVSAGDALTNVTSTDPTVQSGVQTALSQLQKAATAGENVLADCN